MIIQAEKLGITVDSDNARCIIVNGNEIYLTSFSGGEVAVNSNGDIVCVKFSNNRNVYHKGGTSEHSSSCKNCGSWIKHWEKFTGQVSPVCCVRPCAKKTKNDMKRLAGQEYREKADRGAHVTHVFGEDDDMEFIVPVCESDNPPDTREITVAAGTWFVRAKEALCSQKMRFSEAMINAVRRPY